MSAEIQAALAERLVNETADEINDRVRSAVDRPGDQIRLALVQPIRRQVSAGLRNAVITQYHQRGN